MLPRHLRRGRAVRGRGVSAVVSRGRRPDLAIPVIDRVTAPTLLIVGGDDDAVLQLNKDAQRPPAL